MMESSNGLGLAKFRTQQYHLLGSSHKWHRHQKQQVGRSGTQNQANDGNASAHPEPGGLVLFPPQDKGGRAWGFPGELGGIQCDSLPKPLMKTHAATDPRQGGNYVCS